MKTYKPYIAALCYSFFVGLSFLITKLVVPHASATLILAHRFTVSLISVTLFSFFSGKKLNLTKKKVLTLVPITLFYPVLFFSLQIYGLQYASSSEAGIIFATVPIITILFTALLGHPPSKTQALSIVISVSGVVVIFFNDVSINTGVPLGIILLFLSAVSSSIYTIAIKKLLRSLTVFELTYFIIIMGFVVFNTMFAYEHLTFNTMLISYMTPFKNIDYLLGIFYLGFFASLVTSFTSNYALQHINAPQFSVFSNLSTLISILAGAFILDEPLFFRHYLGITLILTGVIGTNFAFKIEGKITALLKNPELN